MSAIAGIYEWNGNETVMEDGLKMMAALERYPADRIGLWSNDALFLGCHAQWLTEESVGRALPFEDRDRGLVITSDAILDNRGELFEKLQVIPERRKAITDSELILLAYERWEEEMPQFLLGDFAFLIWDGKKRRLFGARDFSGGRTLYYYRGANRVVFSTLIRPLLTLPQTGRRLNENWLADYLSNPSMVESIDPASTIYEEINQIPPSHSVLVEDGKVTTSRYCRITQNERLRLRTDEEYEEAFREVFQRAVAARLRTFKPVGAYMSGGLDSGALASFASRTLREQGKVLHTYSYIPVDDFHDWTPKNRAADETPFIRSTVEHVGNIDDRYFDFRGRSPLSEVDDWLDTMEMPYKFFENSFWIKGIHQEAGRDGVGVLLSGQRGNFSVSWGPALDFYAMLLKKMKFRHLYREIRQYGLNHSAGRRRILSAVRRRAFPVFNRMFPDKDAYRFPELVHPALARRTNIYDKLREQGIETAPSAVNMYRERRKHFDQLFQWNLNGACGTKLSLRHSLMMRDPTNDLRVIRFCLSVPEEQYVRNGYDRALIRRSMKSMLPDSVRLNQRIRGIQGADGIHRMRSEWGSFMEELEQLSADSAMSGLIHVPVLKEAIASLRSQPRPEQVFTGEFKVLMRSLILYRFLKKNA